MINLTAIRLVQFYLFEKEEIKIEESTAIFGPNASGKSAILDAFQIAMLGANQTLMSLNSQALPGEKTERTIKTYCLGQFGPGDQRARDSAVTYVTLSWFDTDRNIPISTGVCIQASVDQEKINVIGRYVVPGVDVLLKDHLETNVDFEKPLDWPQFKILLQNKSKAITGEANVFYDDSKAYIRGLLDELKGSTGRIPPYESFVRSFKFAVRMRFDRPIDHIVRREILPDLPTNTGKFKAITDDFKNLKNLVNEVIKKIDLGSRVSDQYKLVHSHHVELACWKALSARVKQAKESYALQQVQEKHEDLTEKLKSKELAYEASVKAQEDVHRQLEVLNSKKHLILRTKTTARLKMIETLLNLEEIRLLLN